ncbi:MAG: hypothetical protein P4L95_12015 [Rouxiella aceris]|uniref:hypothetical protein n=1 Tax=Rouxiella aceris TaxID=2703884 RepID=UPI00283D13C2|nr:hypothetical protein [Rouxiella aceris]MDR3432605.1 hypothetical protein [Rouxiella aceris]
MITGESKRADNKLFFFACLSAIFLLLLLDSYSDGPDIYYAIASAKSLLFVGVYSLHQMFETQSSLPAFLIFTLFIFIFHTQFYSVRFGEVSMVSSVQAVFSAPSANALTLFWVSHCLASDG